MRDKIVSIKKINIESKRYDLSIKDNNNFYANSILVHNCQNVPSYLRSDKDFYISEKLDGQSSSFTYIKRKFFKDEFGICSRTVRKFEFGNSNWSVVAKNFDIKIKLKHLSDLYKIDLAIQGEIIGPRIQGNKYGLTELDFYVFNIYDKTNKKKIDLEKMEEMCRLVGLKTVPIIKRNIKVISDMQEIVKDSIGKSVIKSDIDREGFVWRTHDQSISFKVINPEFLLGEKDE
jgi:hypothetical protein